MEPEINKPISSSNGSNKTIIILGILVLIAVGASIFFYNKTKALGQDPVKVNEAKILALVEKVGKIIDLPVGEVPVMATISDTAPLANNPFFAKAKIGDEVLLYTAAKKAFLYDPKANIVVEVASLNIGK